MKRVEGPHHLVLWYRPLEDRPREWRLTVQRARTLTMLALIGVVVLIAAAVMYGLMIKQTIDVARYKAENQRLREEVGRVKAISADLEELQRLSRQLQRSLTEGADLDPSFEANELPAPEPMRDPMDGDSWLQISAPSGDLRAASWSTKQHIFTVSGANMPQRWPVDGFITRGFEPNIIDPSQSHAGVDIAAPQGSPVRAAAAGVVVAADWTPRLGYQVLIDHGDGVLTVYGHNQMLLVNKHDRVEPGSIIALSGNSGISTAPHIHFEIWIKGEAVDPLTLLHHAGEKSGGTES